LNQNRSSLKPFLFQNFQRVKNPAITHDRRRLDIADLKRDGETSTAGDGGADGISSL